MKKIAFYGKGGIGKSTTAANVSAAFSEMDCKVCQIGCDPKNDSTRLLLGRLCRETVLETVRKSKTGSITAEQIVHTGFNGIQCVEAGGPEPGVGCAGRGIIVALEKLRELQAVDNDRLILYDVLGDVVCGGFAVPIREGYATEIYIVSSGELMSLYAANNIAKSVQRFAARSNVRLGGIIGNSRNMVREKELLLDFAQKINAQLIAFIPRNAIVNQAEVHKKTVIEWAPNSDQAAIYRDLANKIANNKELTVPRPLAFEDLEELVLNYGS